MAGEIRQKIDIAALERYVDKNVPELPVPLEVKQFGYGQSNPTYLLISKKNGKKAVMRKKPPGKLLSKTAHRVDREFRIIHALEKTDVAVPKAFCLCEDDSVVGTAFYIMEFLDGRIFEDPTMPEVGPEERHKLWHAAVTTLAKFHRVAPESVGLSDFGKANGFYNRQLATFHAISEAQAKAVDVETKEPTGKIPHFDEVSSFFADQKSQPKDRSSLIHGDYKIDNVVFHKTEARVIGILDWEMSTIGHPLSDLANLLMPYTLSAVDQAREIGRGSELFLPGRVPGLPSKAECMAWYASVAGWDPAVDMTWGDAFVVYRNSVIMQGIAARFALRQASSAKAIEYARTFKPFGEVTWALVKECKAQGRAKAPKL